MATFKVPKQTKRSKFVVDQFKGVDFTNAGIDVDPTRSPNAPNMIRHTPGKVRKRMGYEKQIQFGSVTNVNFAKGTSAKELEIQVGALDVDTWIELYRFTSKITKDVGSTFFVYYEFDYKCDSDFYLEDLNTTIPASEDWTHYSGSVEYSTAEYAEKASIQSSVEQTIFIKKFAALKVKNSDYVWHPAPNTIIEDSAEDHCVYGRHAYRTIFADNKKSLVNVNRSDISYSGFGPVTFPESSIWKGISPSYELLEKVWTDGENKRKLYIEFDYYLFSVGYEITDVYFKVAGTYSTKKLLSKEATESNPMHFSAVYECGDYSDKSIQVKCMPTTAGNYTVSALCIANLFVGYAIDENYTWDYAPDNPNGPYREESFTPNLYWEGKRNYAEIYDDYYSATYSGDEIDREVTVISPGSEIGDLVKGFFYTSFKLQCTCSNLSGYLYSLISLLDDDGALIELIEVNSFPYDYDLKYYGGKSPYNYFSKFEITHMFSGSASRTCSFTVSDIQIRNISPREATNSDNSAKYDILHIGNSLWLKGNVDIPQKMYTGIASKRSWSAQMGNDLIILDGNEIFTYAYGQADITPLLDTACYTPTVTISKNPNGGGTSFDPLNMLSPAFIEQFVVTSETSTATQFHLSFSNLDNRPVKAWKLNSSGVWIEQREGTDFSVNRRTGVVTFTTAPGVSPISGQDNIKIEAYHTVQGYRDRVAKCKFGIVYGINGRPDRIFVSGNPTYPSQDFFSEEDNFTYFPDINYSSLGSSGGEITGYAYVGNYLGTFKNESDNAKSLIIREGELSKNETYSETAQGFVNTGTYTARFNIVNSLQGEGPVSAFAVEYLNTEPLYLTKKGVFALTTQDVTGNKYGQNRSYYLNGRLKDEPNLEDGYSTIFNDMYILSLNNHLYILDGMQPAINENEPYSARQYSGFYCDNIPATCIWNDGENLYFGTEDGKICRFYNDFDSTSSYNDDGYPIEAWWETPDLDGYLFYKNKTFRYFAVRMMHAIRTSFKLFAQKQSVWSLIKEDSSTGRVFTFDHVDFQHFSFNTDWSEKVSHTKLRVKKVDKARFKLENSNLDEPFGIYDLALEYLENGNYKR